MNNVPIRAARRPSGCVAPVVFVFIVYVYLTLGVIPALRERFNNLTRSAETANRF